MNQRGSVSIVFLTLTPLLLAVIFVLMACYLMMNLDAEASHLCRVELLRSHDKVADHLEKLIALNPLAKRLRSERAQAEASLRFAIGGPAIAAAKAKLFLVMSQQLRLASQQKALILKAQLQNRMGPRQTAQEIKALLKERRWGSRSQHEAVQTRVHEGKLALTTSPPSSLTPDYTPAQDVRKKQEATLRWQIPIEPWLPPWLQETGIATDLKIQGECSATIDGGKKKWFGRLTVGKH